VFNTNGDEKVVSVAYIPDQGDDHLEENQKVIERPQATD
jgi:hypothetical protein